MLLPTKNNMNKQEYKNLADMASNGDTGAFAKLYETIYREMYYIALYSLDNDSDAVEAVTGTVRDGFKSISKLKSENAYRIFMMKTLCARIRAFQKEYKNQGEAEAKTEISRKLTLLPEADRLPTVMYIAAKFSPEEIAAFIGGSANGIRKRLKNALNTLNITEKS